MIENEVIDVNKWKICKTQLKGYTKFRFGYYIFARNEKDQHRYIHKNMTIYNWCGVDNMWGTRIEAYEFLKKYKELQTPFISEDEMMI